MSNFARKPDGRHTFTSEFKRPTVERARPGDTTSEAFHVRCRNGDLVRAAFTIGLLLAATPSLAKDYHLDPASKRTTGPCTLAKPCSITVVSKLDLEPSDRVLFRPGQYGSIQVSGGEGGVIELSNADDGSAGSPTLFMRDGSDGTVELTCLSRDHPINDASALPCSDAANDCDGSGGGPETYANLYRIPLGYCSAAPTTTCVVRGDCRSGDCTSETVQAVYETATPVATIDVNDEVGPYCFGGCTGVRYTFQNPMPYTAMAAGSQSANADSCNKLPGCFFQSGVYVYVHLWDSGDPRTAGMNLEPAVANRAIRAADVDYMSVADLTIKYCPTAASWVRSANIAIDRMTTSSGYGGINFGNHTGPLTVRDSVFMDAQRRGNCDAARNRCDNGVSVAKTKRDGWTSRSGGTCFNVDSGTGAGGSGPIVVSNITARRCDNAAQIMGFGGSLGAVRVMDSQFQDATNHVFAMRPAVNIGKSGVCNGYVFERNIFMNGQETAPYISSCQNGRFIRNASGLGLAVNEYVNASTGWRSCGNLMHRGSENSRYAVVTTPEDGLVQDWSFLPTGRYCRYGASASPCEPTALRKDWQELSGQDLSARYTPFSLAGVSYPLLPYGSSIAAATKASWLPTALSTVPRDALTDLNCDGLIQTGPGQPDECIPTNHCLGGAADIGPFEWGVDVPPANRLPSP